MILCHATVLSILMSRWCIHQVPSLVACKKLICCLTSLSVSSPSEYLYTSPYHCFCSIVLWGGVCSMCIVYGKWLMIDVWMIDSIWVVNVDCDVNGWKRKHPLWASDEHILGTSCVKGMVVYDVCSACVRDGVSNERQTWSWVEMGVGMKKGSRCVVVLEPNGALNADFIPICCILWTTFQVLE